MAQSLYDIPEKLPPIKKSEQLGFMVLWSHIQETLRGDSRDKLNVLARAVGLNGFALRYLRTNNVAKSLIAVLTIGHLGDRAAWKELRAIAKDEESTVLSLSAATSLCKIDGRFAAPVVIPLISFRKDWPAYKIVTMLVEIGPDYIAEPLADSILAASPEEQIRLIRFLKYCNNEKALPVVRKLLADNPTDHILSSCLNVLGYFADKKDLEVIKEYLHHPLWYIRLQAVIAFGKIAGNGEERFIIEKLNDQEWWVRYRAAQALSNLPYMSSDKLERIKNRQKDRYAYDILVQVIEERG